MRKHVPPRDGLEFCGELGGDKIFAFREGVLAAEAILQFCLQVICEAIAEGGVDTPDVVAPFRPVILVGDGAEELLVPAQRAEEL